MAELNDDHSAAWLCYPPGFGQRFIEICRVSKAVRNGDDIKFVRRKGQVQRIGLGKVQVWANFSALGQHSLAEIGGKNGGPCLKEWFRG